MSSSDKDSLMAISRLFVVFPSYLFALVGAGFICSCNTGVKQDSRPNIVIINIDDMGWKDVTYMGSNYYETPNIDKLSAEGMIFTNGYAAAANCAPSRACLMTGQWTPRHGIYTVQSSERGASKDRKLVPIQNTTILDPKHEIIPGILHQNGYTTCHAGKWHLSENPMDYGFDINIGGGHNGHPTSYYPPYGNVQLRGGEEDYLTDLVMDHTLEFLDTVAQPFFLHYTPYAVHTPIHPVESLLEKYVRKTGSNGQQNADYATMIENLDRNIGRLISSLEEKGVFNNTLIIFTSDNGGLYGITKQRPLRAGKGSYYEGGIRVPFFFVYSDVISANTTSEIPISNIDIFPTILHYAGITNNQILLDGTDLSPLLENHQHDLQRPMFWHFPIYLQAYNVHDNENRDSLFRTRPGSVIREGDYKLHYYFEDDAVELYNLAEDIGERKNLASTEPEIRDSLLATLRNWWNATNAPVPQHLNPDYEY